MIWPELVLGSFTARDSPILRPVFGDIEGCGLGGRLKRSGIASGTGQQDLSRAGKAKREMLIK